ncbi:MAG TPA: LysM peptidoglycan-binding domain-containing protein, partial [Candidatus Tectomicrobia bacterium]
ITASLQEFSTGTPVEWRRDTVLAAVSQPADASRQAELVSQAEARLSQLLLCLEIARQILYTAEAAGATESDLASARRALSRAEQTSEQAKAFLAGGEAEQARNLLQTAQTDCLAAQELSRQARIVAASRALAQPERYSVVRGDTLWSIAAQQTIYHNPFMWPLIYRANRVQIRDPDRIFPRQLLTIPRNYSPEEANTAIQRAQTRQRWRQGDGPDVYILEGVRR